jgi:hypothetical protein
MANNDGWSKLAIRVQKPWDGADRPKGWIGSCYGFVLHCTGGGLPTKAKKLGEYPTKTAVSYYSSSRGTHYVIGFRGKEGDLLQVANEENQANGVGVKNTKDKKISQWHSVNERNWEKDLPNHLVKKWHKRWDHTGAKNPLKLFPSQSANSCYIHAEMIPCVYFIDNKLQTDAEPMASGLRYTKAQHNAVIDLVIDVAERNGWDKEWWKTGRFVCHEDITPVSRSNSGGGWDPGVMRDKPFFDWNYVVKSIENHYKLAEVEKIKPVDSVPVTEIVEIKVDKNTDKSVLLNLLAKLLEFLKFKD